MTRGKYSQKAAARMDHSATARIQDLEAELAGERAERAAEVHSLRERLLNAQGQLESRVREIAAERLAAAREVAEAEQVEAARAADERLRSVVKHLFEYATIDGVRMSGRIRENGWQELSTLSGIPLGELMMLDPHLGVADRAVRRATNKTLNRARSGPA